MKRSFFFIILFITTFSLHFASAQTSMSEDVLSTWDKHTQMNSLLMSTMKRDYLRDTVSSGGRNIADQFAHMHNVRMMWLAELDPEVKLEGLDLEIDDVESLKVGYLKDQLTKSNQLVRQVLSEGLQSSKNDRPMTPIRFMGYLISHESHTRGQILLALKQSGHPAPPQVAFGIWQW